MKIRLGYVAISLTLNEVDHYQTITWTKFHQLDRKEGEKKLNDIINHNLDYLERILKYNLQNEVYFYRMSQSMIPLATHPDYSYDYISNYQKKWKRIGKIIKKNKMRIDMHPNQFCVLNSLNSGVLEQTKRELDFCFHIYEALGISSKVILHVGSSLPNKEEALNRFKNNFLLLPEKIKNMILLENDDKVYTAFDVLGLCEELNIPMVLDYHHYLCNHGKEKIEKLLLRIFDTWKNEKEFPKIHFSSPKSMKEKRSHSFYISYLGFSKFLKVIASTNQDCDIMLECKGKDDALFRLIRQIKEEGKYQFINYTTFFLEEKYE